MRRIGVFCSVFDPIHAGHLYAAQSALSVWGLDEIKFIPVDICSPWQIAAEEHDRYEMARLAVLGMERMSISGEVLSNPSCYTADIILRLIQNEPEASYTLIFGSDELETLPEWHGAEKLFSICDFLVYPCKVSDMSAHIHSAFRAGARLQLFDWMPVFGISSAMIRMRIMKFENMKTFLQPAVEEYVALHGLYMPDYADMVRKLMIDKRYAHTIGVRDVSVKLARLHSASMLKAAVAGLMHDCVRDMPMNQMQEYAAQYNVTDDPLILSSSALLHGPAGAKYAEMTFGITDPEILSAITFHTTGRTGMSTLDLCLFVADAIEPGRASYPELEDIRRFSQADLRKAAFLSMQSKREYVHEKEQSFSSVTLQAMAELSKLLEEEIEWQN